MIFLALSSLQYLNILVGHQEGHVACEKLLPISKFKVALEKACVYNLVMVIFDC